METRCPICNGEASVVTHNEIRQLGIRYTVLCESDHMIHLITENNHCMIVRKNYVARMPKEYVTV